MLIFSPLFLDVGRKGYLIWTVWTLFCISYLHVSHHTFQDFWYLWVTLADALRIGMWCIIDYHIIQTPARCNQLRGLLFMYIWKCQFVYWLSTLTSPRWLIFDWRYHHDLMVKKVFVQFFVRIQRNGNWIIGIQS